MEQKKSMIESGGTQKVLCVIGWIVSALQIVLSAAAVLLLKKADVLPGKYLLIIAAVFAVLIVVCRMFMKRKINLGRFVVGAVVALLISAILLVVDYDLLKLTSTLQNITGAETETTCVGVYVLDSDPAQTIEDAADYNFGILQNLSREDTDNAISQINEELGSEIVYTECEDTSALAGALLNKDVQAIILNEAFMNLITDSDEYADFESQIREIASYEWQTEVSSFERDTEDEEEETQEGVFTMFISGIDVAGNISTKSRSDVNILCVVNPNTHQILLVSTPRDYYVPLSISNGVKDKLTHAGIYGVNVSMDTLSMLYNTNVDYYFRINFTGFKEVINALGGITVQSDYAFEAGGYTFVQGANELDGDSALAFSRERHAFAEGDRQRGKDQMAVIQGVINKMMTPAILNDFSGLMAGLEGSFETSLPYDTMTELVKDQLAGGESWNITSYSVDGTGEMNTTYSMNQQLYVMVPDEATVQKAEELIRTVKTGGVPVVE